MLPSELQRELWRFILGSYDLQGLQAAVRAQPQKATSFAPALLHAIESTDPHDSTAVETIREQVASWARARTDAGCACQYWREEEKVPLGYATADLLDEDFTTLRQRNPWLWLVTCKRCGQHWYVAIDTVDDDHYFVRLTEEQVTEITRQDKWPSKFNDFANVWPDPEYPWPTEK